MVKNITFEKTYSRVVGSNPDRVFQANHTVSLIQMQNACVHTFLKMKYLFELLLAPVLNVELSI